MVKNEIQLILNQKEAKYMDSCDSNSRSTYNDGTDLEYISSVCIYAF